MAAPTIPGSTTQAVQPQTGTYSFVVNWWNFFNALLAYVQTGPIGPVPLVGVTDGSVAAAGNIGEYKSSLVKVSPGVSLTSSTTALITSLALTAGDWDLWGEVSFGEVTGGGGVVDYSAAALWTTTTSIAVPKTAYPADGSSAADFAEVDGPATGVSGGTLTLGPMVVNITTSVTFFLSAQSIFSAGTQSAGGAIRARRRR